LICQLAQKRLRKIAGILDFESITAYFLPFLRCKISDFCKHAQELSQKSSIFAV